MKYWCGRHHKLMSQPCSRRRSGDVVRLVELLDEAKDRCTASLRQRREER